MRTAPEFTYAICVSCQDVFIVAVGDATDVQCQRASCPGNPDGEAFREAMQASTSSGNGSPEISGTAEDEEQTNPKQRRVKGRKQVGEGEQEEGPSVDPVTGLLSHSGVDFYDSAEAAAAGLLDADPFEPLQLAHDDLRKADGIQALVQQKSEELYDALLKHYAAAPSTLPEEKKTAYTKSQDRALGLTKSRLQTLTQRKIASINCTITILAVVDIHRLGIPTSARGETPLPDRAIKFSERMR